MGILWAIVVVLLVLWLVGLVAFDLGALVWLLLVAALIILLFNYAGYRSRGRWYRRRSTAEPRCRRYGREVPATDTGSRSGSSEAACR